MHCHRNYRHRNYPKKPVEEHSFRDRSTSFAALPQTGTHAPARLTVLPIRILQLYHAAHLRLLMTKLRAEKSASRSRAFGVCVLKVTASASELDFGACRESRFRQMPGLPAPLGMKQAADAS